MAGEPGGPQQPGATAPTARPPLTPADKGRSFLVRWRELQNEGQEGAARAGLRPLRVALCGTFTLEPLLPYLGVMLAQQGFLPRFLLAPYGQLYPALLAPAATFGEEADVTIALPRLEDLCPRQLAAIDRLEPAAVEEGRAACLAEIDRLAEAARAFERPADRRPGARQDASPGREEGGRGLLLLGTLPPPPHAPLGPLDGSHPASRAQLLRELNLRLGHALQKGGRARLFDLDGAVAAYGASRAYDERMHYLSRCPFSDEFLRHLALGLSRAVAPLFRAPAKVLALDLDNTLWGGIVGEDGPAGLQLGDSGVGAAFCAFQEALLCLRAQGVLLCLVSKNNEADAFEVLDRHPAMRVRREHVSAFRINWQDKATSLRQLAEELSLGLDSFVFVDDNAAECEQVRRALPQVTVLQLPEDPARHVAALRALPALDRMSLTAEDARRAELYAAERARRAAMAGPAEGASEGEMRAYLRSLELQVVVRAPGEADVARVAQLTQKTNQFNLTTIRRSEAEIEQLRADPRWRLYVAEVSDRFGDYGLTGLLFARRLDEAAWEIDTLLLSCRVLGRGVETGVLHALLCDLHALGARALRARFEKTAKNEPARGFLPGHGFRDEGEGRFVLDLDGPRPAPEALAGQIGHLRLVRGEVRP